MRSFANSTEAKAWLIQQILFETESAGTPLDPLEAGMLEYSETARTPANLESLLAAFDEAHDSRTYEERIAAVVRTMLTRWQAEDNPKLVRWNEAIKTIHGQDHYLLVVIGSTRNQPSATKQHTRANWLRILAIAILLTALMTLLLGYVVSGR